MNGGGSARRCARRRGATPRPPRRGPPTSSMSLSRGAVVADLRHAQTGGRAEQGPPRARARPGPGRGGTRRGDEPGHRGRVRPYAHRPRPRRPRRWQDRESLSARERELVTLVAQGRTDAQIAAQLYISIRTVRSHLDRIRDKTGCRRRADLTRLALREGLLRPPGRCGVVLTPAAATAAEGGVRPCRAPGDDRTCW